MANLSEYAKSKYAVFIKKLLVIFDLPKVWGLKLNNRDGISCLIVLKGLTLGLAWTSVINLSLSCLISNSVFLAVSNSKSVV